MQEKRLSDRVADEILTMITIEKRFTPGDQLPNENDLSQELGISRTTLREAIRILAAHGVLEIRRGKGTFVRQEAELYNAKDLNPLLSAKVDAKDLFEIRLIFEPEAAYLATLRATDREIERIVALSRQIEEKIAAGEDRTGTSLSQRHRESHPQRIHQSTDARCLPGD